MIYQWRSVNSVSENLLNYNLLNYNYNYKGVIIAAERASLKRASEAADLICVCRGEFISNHVYRSALWSCAFGNAQNTFPHLCFVTN